MAVKTTFSKEDFNRILSEYDLGEFKNSTPLDRGAVQTNLLIETTKGKFVFRYFETRPKDYALFEVDLLDYLAKHPYPCPAPIKDKNGRFLGEYNDKPFAIIEFMEGEHSESRENHKKIATVIGQLHNITIGYKPERYKDRDTYDPTSSLNNAELNSKKIKSEPKAKERLKWLKAELSKLEIPDDLPKGVCHCDTHPSNFLYKNGEISAVLDFDDASYIYLLYDIANMIYFWAWPEKEEINFDKAREILKEYSGHRALTEAEKEHLYDLLKMVNFMSIGWFIDSDDFDWEKERVEQLNSMGRKEFYIKMFS